MRGQIGTFGAPESHKSSQLIVGKVKIAGINVDGLVNTGATTSCCRWKWYQKWKSCLGPLQDSDRVVVGVGNDPFKPKGVTCPVTVECGPVQDQFELMVLHTLEDVDVILGMDILSKFSVAIQAETGVAYPTQSISEPETAVMDRNLKLPAGKSRGFFYGLKYRV